MDGMWCITRQKPSMVVYLSESVSSVLYVDEGLNPIFSSNLTVDESLYPTRCASWLTSSPSLLLLLDLFVTFDVHGDDD